MGSKTGRGTENLPEMQEPLLEQTKEADDDLPGLLDGDQKHPRRSW